MLAAVRRGSACSLGPWWSMGAAVVACCQESGALAIHTEAASPLSPLVPLSQAALRHTWRRRQAAGAQPGVLAHGCAHGLAAATRSRATQVYMVSRVQAWRRRRQQRQHNTLVVPVAGGPCLPGRQRLNLLSLRALQDGCACAALQRPRWDVRWRAEAVYMRPSARLVRARQPAACVPLVCCLRGRELRSCLSPNCQEGAV